MATTLSSENTFTVPIKICRGTFGIDISGTFVGTLTSQWYNGTSWIDNSTFTSSGLNVGTEPSVHDWRIGFKTGAYTSGSALVNISQ